MKEWCYSICYALGKDRKVEVNYLVNYNFGNNREKILSNCLHMELNNKDTNANSIWVHFWRRLKSEEYNAEKQLKHHSAKCQVTTLRPASGQRTNHSLKTIQLLAHDGRMPATCWMNKQKDLVRIISTLKELNASL